MENVTITNISFEEFNKRLEIYTKKVYEKGIEEGKRRKIEPPKYLTEKQLVKRWSCCATTIKNYENDFGENSLKRKTIGCLKRYAYAEVVRFENFQNLIPK